MKGEKGISFQEAEKILREDGPLAAHLKGFEPREEQIKMMGDVLEAFNRNGIALIEAGTGTGKSMAYLIPAILWAVRHKERTVISTNTINLQEQLIHKDIPLLLKALNVDLSAVLVKGMNNYVCHRKVRDSIQELRMFPTQEMMELETIEAWSRTTQEGSKSSLPLVPSPGVWEKAGAEHDTCQFMQCEFYHQCHFMKARRKAAEAQILVVNHHLLFADLAVRQGIESDEQGILPPYSRVVIDEAHNIEDIATDFFAADVSNLEILKIVGRLASEKAARNGLEVTGKLGVLRSKIADSYKNAGAPQKISQLLTRLQIDIPGCRRDMHLCLIEAFQAFEKFIQASGSGKEEADDASIEQKLRIQKQQVATEEWKTALAPKGKAFVESAMRFVQSLRSLESDLDDIKNDILAEMTRSVRYDILAMATRLELAVLNVSKFLSDEIPLNRVRWVESQMLKTMRNTHLIDADLDISRLMVELLFQKFPTIVMCSATLTTNNTFDFFRQRVGLLPENLPGKPLKESMYLAPYDYKAQALLLIPTDIPHPNDENFIASACEAIWLAVKASRGSAFVLFTSYTMLKQCYDKLAAKLEESRFNVMKQGDGNRNALLDRFKTVSNSVLFGTDSFWEGVDVAGEALRCVIIVKLPFRVPSEPIVQARAEAIEADGGNAFFDYSLPQAVVKFKQGFGRLIRNRKDRGCIICLDNRIVSKRYGKLFLESLPSCQKTFVSLVDLPKHMSDFYRKTHYLVLS